MSFIQQSVDANEWIYYRYKECRVSVMVLSSVGYVSMTCKSNSGFQTKRVGLRRTISKVSVDGMVLNNDAKKVCSRVIQRPAAI